MRWRIIKLKELLKRSAVPVLANCVGCVLWWWGFLDRLGGPKCTRMFFLLKKNVSYTAGCLTGKKVRRKHSFCHGDHSHHHRVASPSMVVRKLQSGGGSCVLARVRGVVRLWWVCCPCFASTSLPILFVSSHVQNHHQK